MLLLPVAAPAVENYPYFITAQSVAGPTGMIGTPSTTVVAPKTWSLGLHRFIVGVNYGVLPDAEIGLNFDLKGMSPLFPLDDDNISRKKQEISLDSKIRLLKEEVHPLDVSLGQRRGMIYLVAGKFFDSLWDTTIQTGCAWDDGNLSGFYSISHTADQMQFLFDYEPFGNRCNLGWRFLASPEIKIDFFLLDITHVKNIIFDNFMFGLTLTE
jgi:hypothetical protein